MPRAIELALLTPSCPGFQYIDGMAAEPMTGQAFFVVPAADLATLTAVTTTPDAHSYLSIRGASRTRLLPRVLLPFKGRQFLIPLPSRNQALQLQRMPVPSG